MLNLRLFNCDISQKRLRNEIEALQQNAVRFFIYAGNEPKSVPARDLGDCRDNLRNSQGVFLIVYAGNEPKSVPARDLGDCRDNLRNSQSVFLIVS